MKIVVDLRKSCLLDVRATKARTGSTKDNTVFFFVWSMKNQKFPAVDAPVRTLVKTEGPQTAGCPLLLVCLSPLLIGSSQTAIQTILAWSRTSLILPGLKMRNKRAFVTEVTSMQENVLASC